MVVTVVLPSVPVTATIGLRQDWHPGGAGGGEGRVAVGDPRARQERVGTRHQRGQLLVRRRDHQIHSERWCRSPDRLRGMVVDGGDLDPVLDEGTHDRLTGHPQAEHDRSLERHVLRCSSTHQSSTPGRLTKSA
jgi:hypothetical protein